MKKIVKHPDIINPYGLEKERVIDIVFEKDINLNDLLETIPFQSPNTIKFARNVLIDICRDINATKYRQAVFNELVSDDDLRNDVRDDVKELSFLAHKLNNFKLNPSLMGGFTLLKLYRDFVNNSGKMLVSNSKTLKQVGVFLREIRKKKKFNELGEFLKDIENSSEVDFRVSIDQHGSPIGMHAMKFIKNNPNENSGLISFLEKLLNKKKYDYPMKRSGGLNELGKIIKEYMDKQFLPVIHAYLDQISEVTRVLEPLDFYLGFADYFKVLKNNGFSVCIPTIIPLGNRKMSTKNAINLLLLKEGKVGIINKVRDKLVVYNANANKVVSNHIDHNKDKNMFIITGPNNGGKTTYIKTIGLIQIMGQQGLFVPAESAEISMVDRILTHFVSPDDITKGEGRYRNELRRMKEILERATPNSLILLDEPCGGTSYEEGQRQSLSLLDGFHELGPAIYFTTHMHLVAKEVGNEKYSAAKNLCVECIIDDKKIQYTYKIKNGASNKSYGEEIAKEIGLMPDAIIETVRKKAAEKGFSEALRRRN